jgi:tubulin-specific chaperone B
MPESQYEQLTDSVLAWKKRQKLGRFDPSSKSPEELAAERRGKDQKDVESKGIKEGKRCRVNGDDGRRGVVRFVGEIEGLGGEREAGCIWVGVELDEPVGRNDGSVKVEGGGGKMEVKRVFECKDKFGVFARPEKVEVGEWPVLDDLEVDEDMEEI